jgi:peptidoglycan/xylan/chitin deacetylase (PgdA/CDA1 family)
MESISKLRIIPITLSEATTSSFTADSIKNCLITFDDGLENIFQHAIPHLDMYGFKGTIFCVAGFIGRSSTWDVYRSLRHLSRQQVRQLSDTGHEIGSHTLTHANLPFLNDIDLVSELRDSKNVLEDITGRQVTSLSFPHGGWNHRVWECARELGYQSATLYRGHSLATDNMYPVLSAGRFDSVDDIIRRISSTSIFFSTSIAASRIASHFAKGTPVWKFRKNYSIV